MGYWATSPCYRFNPLAKVQAQEVEKVLKACRNPHRMHQRSTKASSFSSESLLHAFDLRGSNPPPNEHRLDMELTLNVLEWIPLSVNLCWCYLMFIFLCSLTREAQVAYLIPFRRGAFSKTSSAAPATHLPLNFTFTELPFKTLQYSSIYFIMFQCWTLICFNLVGVWRCNISPRIMDFEHILGHEATACMNDVAWCYHFGSISMETLFRRDQGQSDLSGVEAGHWSVRRWRGKRSNISHQFIITPCDNLKFNIPLQVSVVHVQIWEEDGTSKSSLQLWGWCGADRAVDFTLPLQTWFMISGYYGVRFAAVCDSACIMFSWSPCPPLVFTHCFASMEVMQAAVHLFRSHSNRVGMKICTDRDLCTTSLLCWVCRGVWISVGWTLLFSRFAWWRLKLWFHWRQQRCYVPLSAVPLRTTTKHRSPIAWQQRYVSKFRRERTKRGTFGLHWKGDFEMFFGDSGWNEECSLPSQPWGCCSAWNRGCNSAILRLFWIFWSVKLGKRC